MLNNCLNLRLPQVKCSYQIASDESEWLINEKGKEECLGEASIEKQGDD